MDEPLEKINGWSIWPITDGIHLATRDRPLDDQEIRALTLTRSLYANSRDALLHKIAVQNRLAADLTKDVRDDGSA